MVENEPKHPPAAAVPSFAKEGREKKGVKR